MGAENGHDKEPENGIHFGMSESVYHASKALGSSDIRALLRGQKSIIESKATILGSAIHKIVLEGTQSFTSRYRRRPDDAEGATPADKSATTKTAKKHLLPGEYLLHGDDYDFALDVGRLINAHPELAGVFDGGLSEVSIFWERDGIRLKARLDKLKVRGIGDLKTIANEKQDRLATACKWAIKRHRYDIQAEHYLEARRAIPELVERGLVFGPDRHLDTLYLNRVCEADVCAFQFVFVATSGVPNLWGCTLSSRPDENPMLASARADIERALEMYRAEREAFDSDPHWARIEPVEELFIDEMPGGAFGWQ